MIEPWVYAALTAIAVVAGFIDAIAGGGGLIMHSGAAVRRRSAAPRARHQQAAVGVRDGRRAAQLLALGPGRMATEPADRRCWSSPARSTGALVVQSIRTRLLEPDHPAAAGRRRRSTSCSRPRMTRRGCASSASAPPAMRRSARAIGFYDGFFGPGTGTFFTTSLVALRGYGLTRATGADQAVQPHQQRRERAALRARRPYAVAARPVHGGGRDGRRLARHRTAPCASARG